jgi:hypothetical protein
MASQLGELKSIGGANALIAYLRNVRLSLYATAKQFVLETKPWGER